MPQRSPRPAGVKERGAAAVTVEWLLKVVPAEEWPGVGVAPAVDWTVMAVALVALVDLSSVTACPC